MQAFFRPFKSSSEKAPTPMSRDTESVAPNSAPTVVELFQSQGCSSCPPTNASVLQLLDQPNLLILTYHVTYWDRLGWKDTFGKSAFDQRQWDYARALQRKTVYTPQVIVNGQVEGVGNSSRDLQALISTGIAFSATKTVEISFDGIGEVITVSGPEHEHGLVTVVDYDSKPADVPILRGENSGRTLPHNNIVRDVMQIGKWTGGSRDFVLPRGRGEDGLKRAVLVSAGPGSPILGAYCM